MKIGVLGTRQQLATVPVRKVTLKELVPVREAELTLAVEEKLVSHLVTFELFRERIGKELQRRNCSAMDESGDFKFTSREKLLELGRMMELSGSELQEFVVEQQEYEQRKQEHEQWMKEIEVSERKREQEHQQWMAESERQAELEHKRWVKEMEDRERQAELEHKQKMRDLKETLKERERDVRQRQRDHDAIQSACKTEDEKKTRTAGFFHP